MKRRKLPRARDEKYPLPRPGAWLEEYRGTNDNPWDWLRLDAFYAYPPKVVERPIRKPKGQPLPDPRPTETVVEIRCVTKDPTGWTVPFPCKCGRAQDGDRDGDQIQPPDKRLHDKATIRIRHRRLFNLPTWLIIERRRYECRRCGERFYEQFDGVNTDIHVTDDLRRDIAMTAIKRPFSDAAALTSVSEDYARRIFHDYASSRLKDYHFQLPTVLGVDEVFLFDRKRACFVVADLYKKRILDFGDGKKTEDIIKMFRSYRRKELAKVKVFVQDMDKTYRDFARVNFKNAKIVIDKFHVLKQLNECMDAARKEFGSSSEGLRKSLSKQRFLFLETLDKMTDEDKALRDDLLSAYPTLHAAYETKRRFYAVYQQDTREGAERLYRQWIDRVMDEEAVHFRPMIETMSNWHNEIFNYFDFRNRYNNGFVEAMNGRIRRMYDFSPNLDFETLRAKALLRYGAFHARTEYKFYNLNGLPRNLWRQRSDEGQNISSGFDPDPFFEDLERGVF